MYGSFHAGLTSREDGDFSLDKNILPVLSVRTRAKGLGEVHIEKIVIPFLATAHAMSIGCHGQQIPFYTGSTRLIIAEGAV